MRTSGFRDHLMGHQRLDGSTACCPWFLLLNIKQRGVHTVWPQMSIKLADGAVGELLAKMHRKCQGSQAHCQIWQLEAHQRL
jgi:hypothetical protein